MVGRSQLGKAFLFFMAITICLLSISMSSKQPPNQGSYWLVRTRTPLRQAQIRGTLIDKQTKEKLKIAAIDIDGQQTKADTNGLYNLTVKPGSYAVTGVCYPYHPVTTKRVKIRPGDVLTIDFQLLADKTPLEN